MLKKKNVDESIYHEARVRFVTEEFSGLGINGHEGDVFLIAANVPAPPCLLQNSEHYDGPAPFNAIRYDQAAHESYMRANMPRVEPKPAITTMLTAAEVCEELGGGAKRTFASRARLGFPSRPGGARSPAKTVSRSVSSRCWSPETVTRLIARVESVASRRTLTSFLRAGTRCCRR